jgi:single-strand DNA-binding protein
MTMNKIQVIGHVGADPEMRYTPNGNPVTSFRVAANHRYSTAEGEQREETEWFSVSAWNRLAETCNQYVTKGMKVFVDGRLRSRPYTAGNGELRAGNEISAFTVLFLDRAGMGSGEEGQAGPGGPGAPGAEEVEDLPW